ncbi:MAG: tRNA pseudouridine(38-40) synthase TruA [Eubacteriales bacterium]|nr:tRNA pseudouridine(38-40) synthase TruA [Eubacteriales bacterium]
MQHYALLSEYDGSCFHGWQEQANAHSVQQSLREGWYKLSGEDVQFRGSSRTDAGVSAWGHVSDFYSASKIPFERMAKVFNSYLPEGLAVRNVRPVATDFDARFQAVGKLYMYALNCDTNRSALWRNLSTHCPKRPAITPMKELATTLEGEHDFTAFMDQGSVVRRTVRSIDRLEIVAPDNSPWILIFCLGRGFLYHQVRIIAGTLYYVGLGKLCLYEVQKAMAAKDRKPLGKTMPPQGLSLLRVYYPETVFGQDDEAAYQKMLTCSPRELCPPQVFAFMGDCY